MNSGVIGRARFRLSVRKVQMRSLPLPLFLFFFFATERDCLFILGKAQKHASERAERGFSLGAFVIQREARRQPVEFLQLVKWTNSLASARAEPSGCLAAFFDASRALSSPLPSGQWNVGAARNRSRAKIFRVTRYQIERMRSRNYISRMQQQQQQQRRQQERGNWNGCRINYAWARAAAARFCQFVPQKLSAKIAHPTIIYLYTHARTREKEAPDQRARLRNPAI